MNLLALIQRLRTLDMSAQAQLEAKLRWMLLDCWACAVASPTPDSSTAKAKACSVWPLGKLKARCMCTAIMADIADQPPLQLPAWRPGQ